MLKRLELIGFKSFADRTRFDFAPGITAVVGPNGSGKSNIVDAVRWLLGEQSAKSLRGGEMTDVIFNGSSTRKSLGLAEVTMTFDNATRGFGVETDEVTVTRRVYRDGAGEYLINGQASRLKDIKELFLGTGAAHGAYSVIEQGRVDALLSASTKDRRVIFEEAAGISRFKAKKIETHRKLERVDGDLVRVHDILTELEKQLRTLRLQAAKAQRYQEYTTRLKELRVAAGRSEYRELTAALTVEEEALTGMRTELATAGARTEGEEAELRTLDHELGRTEDALRFQEARLADARQTIAAQETTARVERNQTASLEAELLRLGKQRADLGARTRTAEGETLRIAAEVETVARLAEAEEHRAATTLAAVGEATARIAELARRAQADRERQFELVSRSARLHGEAEVAQSQAARLTADLTRKQTETSQTSIRHDALVRLLDELAQTDADLRQRLTESRESLAALTLERDELRSQADVLQQELETVREERSALRGRAEVLEGLERSLEGFGTGVRAVLLRLQTVESPIAGSVFGVVADLVTAPRDVAPLIDLALGEVAQRFVVRSEAELQTVLAGLGDLPGRVGFLPLHSNECLFNGRPGTPNGECDQPPPLPAAAFVRCDRPELGRLPLQLLGKVHLVEDLPTARSLALNFPGYRFVTRLGEVLEPDGSVTIGPVQSETGILSRKSELRDLQLFVAGLDTRIHELESRQTELRTRADALDAPIHAREAEIDALTGEAGSLRDQILERRQIRRQLADTLELLAKEAALVAGELRQAEVAGQEAERLAAEADQEAEEVRQRLAELDRALGIAEQDREHRIEENTAAQVALTRVNEQRAGLRKKREELESELRQRRVEAVNLSSAERSVRNRLQDAALTTLRATAAAAEAYAEKEARERNIVELSVRRESARFERDRLHAAVTAARSDWNARRDQVHARELTARDLMARREAIASRIRDEYGVELTDEPAGELVELTLAPATETTPDSPPADPQQEMATLRQKIAKLGSVNLEALVELAEVETRDTELRKQFDDLSDARGKLQQIIDQINTDSRRLFSETLSTVRGHFQELFRKLFGGGMADVILEDDSDVLESGIEITAKPPGKELTRISLLSGGERALTAVALLLAIFRSRPSPFCLLDEVDAAMDEANTTRLAGLLREFCEKSQFIVITHKKRTMAIADVLYGVTMQESGVSKLVAVRFEDWPEDKDEENRQAA